MRRVRYQVASSIDGYIAGPQGEADWIVAEPEIDFDALFDQFDTLLMGRGTYEWMVSHGGGPPVGKAIYVFSGTLRREEHPRVFVTSDIGVVRELKTRPGKDIWLFGGGSLFRSLAAEGLVDTVEVALIPVLLGGGIPLYSNPAPRLPLELKSEERFPSGIVLLEYEVATGGT